MPQCLDLSPVRVSVCVVAYNQERYVARALESALAQETSFRYEIVVSDDCSTDGTQRIIERFQDRHPDRIRLIARPSNLGISRNFLETYGACVGQYVAFLDGDDYWTNCHKLQRQFELLEGRPDLALCFHRVRIVSEGASAFDIPHPPAEAPIPSTCEDLLQGDCMATSSTMVRRLFQAFPPWCATLPAADWTAFVLHSRHGGIGFLDDAMSVYRVHPDSHWSSLPRIEKLPHKIETRRRMAEWLGAPFDAVLAPVIERLADELIACGTR